MPPKSKNDQPAKRVSRTTMLLGAAGLFLFIVGVKRSMRPDEIPGSTESGREKADSEKS